MSDVGLRFGFDYVIDPQGGSARGRSGAGQRGASPVFIFNATFQQFSDLVRAMGLGRWIQPMKKFKIGKSRKSSHIIRWVSVVSGPLSVAHGMCPRPGWQSMAFVFHNGQPGEIGTCSG